MWLVIKLQMQPPPHHHPPGFCSSLHSAPSLELLTRETNPARRRERGRTAKEQENNKKQEQRPLEGITAQENWLNCLCVKSKGEEGQAGDREPGEKNTELLWAPADCRAASSHWWPLVMPGGHVGLSIGGVWDEQQKQGKRGPLQSSLGATGLHGRPLACLETDGFPLRGCHFARRKLSTVPSNSVSSHHQGRLA